jgi:putative membrane protein
VNVPAPTLPAATADAPSATNDECAAINERNAARHREIDTMIRTILLTAAVAAPLALPAMAEAPQNPAATNAAEHHKLKGNLFNEQQAREHLSRLGYTGISDLSKDENGTWRGTATKNGKLQQVAVDVKGNPAQ